LKGAFLWVSLFSGGQMFCGACGGTAPEPQLYRSISKVEISAEEREKALNATYARVAEKYFPVVRTLRMHDSAALKKSARAERSLRGAMAPGRVTGLVVDRMNVTVPGASILVTDESAEQIVGRGLTDQQGRFAFGLFSASYRSLSLHVIAKGYAKWIYDRVFGGIEDWPVLLDRTVDRSFMKTLAAAQDPEPRLWMLLEIIGARRSPVDIAEVFPYLGELRGDLQRVVNAPAFYEKDDDSASPAERALEFLAYWREPADIAYLKERLSRKKFTIFRQTVIAGNSPSEVCGMWAASFLAQAELDPKPPSSCGKTRYSLDKRRALIELIIFEPYSTYSHILTMVNNGKGWELMLVKYGR
jgi:hypothetical protein